MTQPSRSYPIPPLAWALILVLSLLWGGSYFFAGVAVAELPPLTIVTLRVGMGLLNNAIPFSLIVWGQTQIGSGLASIMNATTPIFAVLVAHALPKAIGVTFGFVGIVVLFGADIFTAAGDSTFWPLIACAGAALSYSFAGVFGRRFAFMGLQPLQTATGQLTCSTLLLLPLALLTEQPWTLSMLSMEVAGSIIGIAIFSTALAYFLYFRILELAGAVNLLLVTFIIPPFAIFMGVMVLDETLLASQVAGLVLILIGLGAIDGRVLRLLDRR